MKAYLLDSSFVILANTLKSICLEQQLCIMEQMSGVLQTTPEPAAA